MPSSKIYETIIFKVIKINLYLKYLLEKFHLKISLNILGINFNKFANKIVYEK